jgi:hypothetical protein
MVRQLRESNWLSFAPDASHVDISAQGTGGTKHGRLVRKLVDRTDDDSAVLAPAIGARLSPPVLPDVGATVTFGSPFGDNAQSIAGIVSMMPRSSCSRTLTTPRTFGYVTKAADPRIGQIAAKFRF